MLSKKLLHFTIAMLLLPVLTFAQNTTGSISGSVKADNGEVLVGATISVLHIPTGTVYNAQTKKSGLFDVSNVQPGGPYAVTVSYVNYQSDKKEDIYVALGEVLRLDVTLFSKIDKLKDVTVTTSKRGLDLSVRGGTQTIIGRDKLENLPTVGRNVQDFLRFNPTVKFTGNQTDLAGVSIAGQNNRFNSFYIDGAVNNDQFGLSKSGTNGGQAGVGPISIDAIDQFQVMISPYDASIGNFTGGGINATTKGGTNKMTGTVYSFTQNENLTGKTPTGAKNLATKLSPFSAKTIGASVGGALIKNKLFYFVNFESIENERPQVFPISGYKGTTTAKADIDKLVDFVKKEYNYDMGGYENNTGSTSAKRLATKIDWNINSMNKFSLSYRYNEATTIAPPITSSSRVFFFNGGVVYPNKTNSLSAELKTTFKNGSSNKMLFTYTDVLDDRTYIGDPFPRVNILDGSGQIVFGSEEFSGANLLEQTNWNFLDFYKFNVNKHAFTVGVDYELSKSNNVFIRNNFGNYRFDKLSDFMNKGLPSQYDRQFSLLDNTIGDNTRAAASFYTGRGSAFINDEIRYSDNLTLNFGIRADYTAFLSTPIEDPYFNLITPKIYDFNGARSGSIPNPKVSISPRIGFTYKMPEENITLRGGLGMFTGRVPLVWPGGIYNNTGRSIGAFQLTSSTIAARNIQFKPDPFKQYTASELGIDLSGARGEMNLISQNFRLPKLLRASLAMDKKLKNNWSITAEGSISKNINEVYYRRLDLAPPVGQLSGPDNRFIYNNAAQITWPSYYDVKVTTSPKYLAPYTGVFLLENQPFRSRSGFAYNFTASIDKAWTNGFSFNAFYTYGASFVTHEPTSDQNSSQWRNMESVNGRNTIGRTRSDFDLGHRISVFAAKKFTYAKEALATTISLVYNGQSGNPFSYTYSNGPVRDWIGERESNDLIFIPTAAQIKGMTFVPNSSFPLTAPQQAEALENYISQDKYLSSRRGQYAERNGSRLPFTNIIDVKFIQDFNVKLYNKKYQFQITYDIFNFTNMLNRDWGRNYFLNFDNYSLIRYASLSGSTTPSYSFAPVRDNTPWGISSSVQPTFSARWTSQLGLRFKF
jgi:hypothetical protein